MSTPTFATENEPGPEPLAAAETGGLPIPLWGRVPLWVAVALVVAELVSWGFGLWVEVSWVPLGMPAVLGPVAVLGWSRDVAVPAVAKGIAAFCAVVIAAAAVGIGIGVGVAAALLASAAGEEAVFRVAIPVLIVAALSRVGVAPRLAAVAAGTFAAASFAFMPGHVAQAGSAGVLPWAVLAAMWMWMLWRGMPMWVLWLSHASMNSAAAAMDLGASPLWWPITLGTPVLAVYGWGLWVDHRRDPAPAPAVT